MELQWVTVDAFDVRGISVTTDNACEMGAEPKIPHLWERFHNRKIWTINAGDTAPVVYGVYHRYEEGVNGSYRVLAGCPSDHVKMAEGIEELHIPVSTYAVFTSNKGPISRVVPETWMKIWEWFQQTDQIHRSFLYDFERYDGRACNPEQAIVEIYIGVDQPAVL
ncbi:GyrI-like domain-containing protein [Salinithrix halophila]|uniref:GyrI-like domain-containing protein n=1 Tax=Salinithrix halophila TaxID=1485204 RepID=A0ABV8JHE1_9BACL